MQNTTQVIDDLTKAANKTAKTKDLRDLDARSEGPGLTQEVDGFVAGVRFTLRKVKAAAKKDSNGSTPSAAPAKKAAAPSTAAVRKAKAEGAAEAIDTTASKKGKGKKKAKAVAKPSKTVRRLRKA